MRLRPNPRLWGLLLVGVVPAAVGGRGLVLAVLWDLAVLCVLGLDAWWRLGESPVSASLMRQVATQLTRNKPIDMALALHNRTKRALRVHIWDRLPADFVPQERTTSLLVEAGAQRVVTQSVVAHKRGPYFLPPAVAEYPSPLGLFSTQVHSAAHEVHVLPDTQALGQFDALVRQRKLHEMGVARVRERGEGSEIAGLRAYVPGDPFGRIDWKATARRGAPVSREMHTERRQNVVLLFDCGRRMAREIDGRSRLDHAVEAALLLAHVALRSDDRVGLVAFADQVQRMLDPMRGPAGARALARGLFDLDPVLREPPYESIAAQVSRRFSKRALLVLFTDAAEPESLRHLVKPVHFLGRRHLVLCVTFQDTTQEAMQRSAGSSTEAFYRAGAAADLVTERQRALRLLQHAGALLLEAPAAKLSAAVVNRYLQVKARHLL